MSANALLFISCAGEIGFVPVIAEMRDPREFRKALYLCMGFVATVYLSFSVVGKTTSLLISGLLLIQIRSLLVLWPMGYNSVPWKRRWTVQENHLWNCFYWTCYFWQYIPASLCQVHFRSSPPKN